MGRAAVREVDGEVRGRLLDAATELFGRKGYAATSVREIVAAAGVTPPVLYYYFESKEGLFLELMRQPQDRFDALVAEVRDRRGSAREKIQRLCERVLSLFLEAVGVARVMYSVYYGPPQGAPAVDMEAYHDKFREAVRRPIEEGIRTGEFGPGDAEAMMWAVIGAVNVAMELELSHPERGLGEEGLRRVLEVIFRGMAAGEAAQRKGVS